MDFAGKKKERKKGKKKRGMINSCLISSCDRYYKCDLISSCVLEMASYPLEDERGHVTSSGQ